MFYILYFGDEICELRRYFIQTTRKISQEYLEDLLNEAYQELNRLEEKDTFDGDYNEFIVDFVTKELKKDKYSLKKFTEINVDVANERVDIE